MIFFVFSFNRGQFLKNCIDSIEYCSPDSSIIIYDDQSDDPATLEALNFLAAKHPVISSNQIPDHKHGGLYSNMQAALNSVKNDQIVCFIQDDLQLVRRLDESDHFFIAECFEKNPNLGFLSPAFIRGISVQKSDIDKFYYNTEMNLFFWRETERSAGVYYSDIFISTSGRLRSHGWYFRNSEPANQEQAKSEFLQMGYMCCPFLMWLPYGPAYRSKKKTFALSVAEKNRGCGFYPFRYMTDDEVSYLRSCSGYKLPIAEEFLTSTQEGLEKPWIYNPLQGSRLLKHLSRAEIFLKSLLSRGN